MLCAPSVWGPECGARYSDYHCRFRSPPMPSMRTLPPRCPQPHHHRDATRLPAKRVALVCQLVADAGLNSALRPEHGTAVRPVWPQRAWFPSTIQRMWRASPSQTVSPTNAHGRPEIRATGGQRSGCAGHGRLKGALTALRMWIAPSPVRFPV